MQASELLHFRNRIGTDGIELIFQESIRINGKDAEEQDSTTNTTVQEKISPIPPIINYMAGKTCVAIANH
jgi:transposase, IS5 family